MSKNDDVGARRKVDRYVCSCNGVGEVVRTDIDYSDYFLRA